MNYKYTFKMYIRDKFIELWECVQSNLVYPIAFIGIPLGILIMDIILYRNYKGTEDITYNILLANVAWIGLCILIGNIVDYIAKDFKYEKWSKESESTDEEETHDL